MSGRPQPTPTGPVGLALEMVQAARAIGRGAPRQAAGAPASSAFRCTVCGGEDASDLFAHEVAEAYGYHVVRCTTCGLVATHPAMSFEEVHRFYGSVYYGTENAKFGPLTSAFVLLFRIARLRALRAAGVRDGSVLDIGSGGGLFLRVLERSGYDAWGTELNEEAARGARRIAGQRVRVGPLAECGFAPRQFHAVTAWQVFEHLADPRQTLRECRRILRPGGVLLLSVPNIESWQARWAGAQWFHLDLPRHLFHYSPQTLGRLLELEGFRVERVSHYSLEQNPFGILQSALHRFGRPHFGLYGLLRGPSDRARRDRLRRLPGYAAYLASFPFAAALAYVESAARCGGTFTIVARLQSSDAADA